MIMPGPPLTRHLVGHLAWLGDNRLFWFAAHGMAEGDAYELEFDELWRVVNRGVCFLKNNHTIAYLSVIAPGIADQPESYLFTKELWRTAVTKRAALVCRCCTQMHRRHPRQARSCPWLTAQSAIAPLCRPSELHNVQSA